MLTSNRCLLADAADFHGLDAAAAIVIVCVGRTGALFGEALAVRRLRNIGARRVGQPQPRRLRVDPRLQRHCTEQLYAEGQGEGGESR